jgi:hypothetical protein
MKKIAIAPGLSLPLDLVTMRTAVYGTSGAGKTTFARLIAELVHAAGQRFCAIDLKNDWWGLKSSADGKSAGIPVVIFGGPRRDVQIFPDGGELVAETVVSIEQSCIVDLDDFSKGKQLRFLSKFFNRLYDLNRKPLLVFGDEADRYASQKPMSIEAHESLGAAEDIARRGRKRGIGSFWNTQRTAVLNKNVSDICDLTVVFRTPGSRDLKDLEERVGRVATKAQVAEVMRAAPGLDDGQAIFLSSHPKLRQLMPEGAKPLQLPLPWTFDSSATPGVGQRRSEPKVLAKSDLEAIEKQMAAQVERAKADDPQALRATIAKLQADLRAADAAEQARTQLIAKAPPKIVDRPILKAKDANKLEAATKRLTEAAASSKEVGDYIASLLRKMCPLPSDSSRLVFESGPAAVRTPPQSPRSKISIERATTAIHSPAKTATPGELKANNSQKTADNSQLNPVNSIDLPPRRQKILNELAFFGAIGVTAPPRSQLAFLCDVSPSSSTFEKDLGALKTAGLVVYPGSKLVQITDAGLELAVVDRRSLSLEEFHAKVFALLEPRRAKILRALIGYYPASLTRDQLAEELVDVSPTSSTFEKDLGAMKTAGLLLYPAKGSVAATDLLFPAL